MLGIFAKSLLTATRHDLPQTHQNSHAHRYSKSWLDEDLPFRNHAGRRSGRGD